MSFVRLGAVKNGIDCFVVVKEELVKPAIPSLNTYFFRSIHGVQTIPRAEHGRGLPDTQYLRLGMRDYNFLLMLGHITESYF